MGTSSQNMRWFQACAIALAIIAVAESLDAEGEAITTTSELHAPSSAKASIRTDIRNDADHVEEVPLLGEEAGEAKKGPINDVKESQGAAFAAPASASVDLCGNPQMKCDSDFEATAMTSAVAKNGDQSGFPGLQLLRWKCL